MTLEEIKAIPREWLTPAEVGAILDINPQSIRVSAKQCPERLGFRVSVIGTRVKVPRRAFLRWMEGQDEKAASQNTKEV